MLAEAFPFQLDPTSQPRVRLDTLVKDTLMTQLLEKALSQVAKLPASEKALTDHAAGRTKPL